MRRGACSGTDTRRCDRYLSLRDRGPSLGPCQRAAAVCGFPDIEGRPATPDVPGVSRRAHRRAAEPRRCRRLPRREPVFAARQDRAAESRAVEPQQKTAARCAKPSPARRAGYGRRPTGRRSLPRPRPARGPAHSPAEKRPRSRSPGPRRSPGPAPGQPGTRARSKTTRGRLELLSRRGIRCTPRVAVDNAWEGQRRGDDGHRRERHPAARFGVKDEAPALKCSTGRRWRCSGAPSLLVAESRPAASAARRFSRDAPGCPFGP